MKRFLSVLLAVLIICMTAVPALAAGVASGGFSSLDLVHYAIETFGEASSRIHEAYADTLQKAMDYRKYYNEQGLAKAYDKMQVSMRNQGTPAYSTVLNTQNQTFYDMSRDYTYTYNTAYYNNTYNSYYIPVTYNDVDYNYFITYAPTYTNITYIVDGCNDPAQAVSNNYYFQLPDGRNSYDLTADEVFGIPLAGDVVNYEAVLETDNCLALFHFDGDLTDSSGNGVSLIFNSGYPDQFVSSSSFGKYLYLNSGSFTRRFSFDFPEIFMRSPFTVEFRLQLGSPVPFTFSSSNRSSVGSATASNKIVYTSPQQDVLYTKDDNATSYSNAYVTLNIPLSTYTKTASPMVLFGPSRFLSYAKSVELYDRSYVQEDGETRIYWNNGNASGGNAADAVYIKNRYFKSEYENFIISNSPAWNMSYTMDSPYVGNWVSLAYCFDGSGTVKIYTNGVCTSSSPYNSTAPFSSFTFVNNSYFSYFLLDEIRVSRGVLYTGDYAPATAPFDIPTALVLPSDKTDGNIAVKSSVPVSGVRLGGVRPSYPSEGDVYISLDSEKAVTSCQQYQSGSWVECDGAVCENDEWVNISGYSFAGQVVSEEDFADVVDKTDDPEVGSAANPDSEITSFTVHYYKEGTEEKIRRDTVYQNLAVGASFTADAPTVAGYKALASSADITITAYGEHIFYYSVDEVGSGGGGGEEDKNSPGFFEKLFDGLLSGVKGLFNIIFGFVGGIVESLLSGITGIISTLIDAFKAVLSLGGHFGDFLAAALGFIPREIIDLLIAGIAVSIVLAIVRFIRG